MKTVEMVVVEMEVVEMEAVEMVETQGTSMVAKTSVLALSVVIGQRDISYMTIKTELDVRMTDQQTKRCRMTDDG